jgi:hypothetical protein
MMEPIKVRLIHRRRFNAGDWLFFTVIAAANGIPLALLIWGAFL